MACVRLGRRLSSLTIRQVLTQKEIRLRAPFDPVPYSALADSCERFFDYLVAVRQSALYFNPDYVRDNPVAAEQLLSFRRDAVATILGNLYILAGALRSQRKVPVSSQTFQRGRGCPQTHFADGRGCSGIYRVRLRRGRGSLSSLPRSTRKCQSTPARRTPSGGSSGATYTSTRSTPA